MKLNHYLSLAMILLSLSAMNLQAQSSYPVIERSTDWVLYQESNGVQQFYKFSECNIPEEGFFREYVLVKLVNTTAQIRYVDWDIVKWYGENCVNPDGNLEEQHRSLILQPNETVEGSCSLDTDKTLKMFSKFLNYKFDDWVLSNFELRNYTVK
jgi:hypothetical protein